MKLIAMNLRIELVRISS